MEENGDKRWYLRGKLVEGKAIQFFEARALWNLKGKLMRKGLFDVLAADIRDLPLFMGKGYDETIAKRLRKGE